MDEHSAEILKVLDGLLETVSRLTPYNPTQRNLLEEMEKRVEAAGARAAIMTLPSLPLPPLGTQEPGA